VENAKEEIADLTRIGLEVLLRTEDVIHVEVTPLCSCLFSIELVRRKIKNE